MIKALAPTTPRGRSWVWALLVLMLIGGLPVVVRAQSDPPASKGTPTKGAEGDATKKAAEKGKDGEPAAEPQAEEKAVTVEIYEEPAAQAAAENKFSPITARKFNPRDVKTVEGMANGAAPDADLIQRYIAYQASELTSRGNINAMQNPDQFKSGSAATHAIRDASAALLRPIELARKGNNAAFLKVYTQALVKESPKLLSNHLVARLETIIALAQTGSPEALDTFVKQLDDAEQSVWVKQWAARGITNILQTPTGFRDDIPGANPRTVNTVAKSLSKLLGRDDLPWPVQLRVLEALGALRQAADPTAQKDVEYASAVVQILSNADNRPEVRAEAAWALGMMRVSSAAGAFNYPLIAYYIGEVAADLGDRIASTYESNWTLSHYWMSPLLYQVNAALNGQEGVRDTGLLRMQMSPPQQKAVREVADLIKPVAKSAIELYKSPKGGREKLAKELSDRVGQLRAYLDKNPPAQKSLIPGGRPFPLRAEMAGAPVDKERIAGAAPAP